MADETPPCFGKEWDGNNSECRGGYEHGYINPINGSNSRDQCIFFRSCGAHTQAARVGQARLVPTQNLVRLPPAAPSAPVQAPMQTMATQFGQVQQQQRPLPPQAPVPQPVYQQQQQPMVQQVPYGYQQMQPVNYQMPGYLTTPQMQQPNESFASMLAKNLMRSMAKAAGHSFSHVFDVTPLGDIWGGGNNGNNQGGQGNPGGK